jgi:hypothetical protein
MALINPSWTPLILYLIETIISCDPGRILLIPLILNTYFPETIIYRDPGWILPIPLILYFATYRQGYSRLLRIPYCPFPQEPLALQFLDTCPTL